MLGKANIDLKALLTIDELCELLQVKKSWIYTQLRDGNIPYLRLGKHLTFYQPEIEKWIAQCQVKR